MGMDEDRSGDSHARNEENGGDSAVRVEGGEEKASQGDVHAAFDAGADESRVSASEEKGNEGNQAENGREAESLGDHGDDAEEAAAPAAAVAGGGDAEAEAEGEAEGVAEGEAEEVVAVVVEEVEGADEKGDGEGEGGEGEEQVEETAAEEEEKDEEGDGEGEDEDEEEDEEEEGEEEEGGFDEGKAEGAGAPVRRAAPRMSREARSIYERIRARPCRVARVIIAGNKRTKAAIISRIMAGALAELAEAQPAEAESAGGTFEDLQAALLRANRALRGLGVFEDVTIVVDALPGDPPGTATVVINVKEDSVLAANVGTYLQRDGRTSEARITLKNLLGYAESLDVSLGVGHDGASSGISSWSILQTAGNSFALSLSCPLLLLPPSLQSLLPSPYSHPSSSSSSASPASPASDAPTTFPYVELRLFKTTRSMLPYTSLSQCLRGATLGLHVGRHELAYELTWRENSAVAATSAESTTKTSSSSTSTASSSSGSGSGGGDGGGGSGIAPAPAVVRGVCSPAVQRDLGNSLLSAVRYVYSIDKRDSQVRPRIGYAMRATTELAGLGTDPKLVSFLRQELELATALPLPIANAAFTSSFRIGALLPWSLSSLPSLPSLPALSRSPQPAPSTTSSSPSPASLPPSSPSPPHSLINDRFFLGGPSSLRGFQDHAVGPTAPRPAPSRARDFLGGDLSLSATTALSFDLPFLKPLQQAGVHGHVLASAGALLSLESVSGAAGRAWAGQSVGGEGGGAAGGVVGGGGVGNVAGRVVEVTRSVGREVLAAMRCTAGVGLVWPTLIGRLEVSCAFVDLTQQSSCCNEVHGGVHGGVHSGSGACMAHAHRSPGGELRIC
ncbi:unnamed protein product [Closterium sp. Naga37s-1]|nr:unnamed protein product [Closterium sp. Naga37s-1]